MAALTLDGEINFRQKNYSKANGSFQQVIDLITKMYNNHPMSAIMYYRLAMVCKESHPNDYDKRSTYLKKAMSIIKDVYGSNCEVRNKD